MTLLDVAIIRISTLLILFLAYWPAYSAADESIIQISFLTKYDTPKYDRKRHNQYNTRANKHKAKYDKSKHETYNKNQNPKRVKYDRKKHNKYNQKNKKQFAKHTKKHTKKYYIKYKKFSK